MKELTVILMRLVKNNFCYKIVFTVICSLATLYLLIIKLTMQDYSYKWGNKL